MKGQVQRNAEHRAKAVKKNVQVQIKADEDLHILSQLSELPEYGSQSAVLLAGLRELAKNKLK